MKTLTAILFFIFSVAFLSVGFSLILEAESGRKVLEGIILCTGAGFFFKAGTYIIKRSQNANM